MNKINFTMTPDEYYLGWKYKNKKAGSNDIFIFAMCAIIFVAIVLITIFVLKSPILYLFAALIALLPFYRVSAEKRSVKNNFTQSPISSGEHTLVLTDSGIEIINGFEKIYCPFGTVFAVKETEENLIIIPLLKKGVITINKKRYNSDELTEIIAVLREKENVEVAKK